jgi:outer membrane protein assembly factor BamA
LSAEFRFKILERIKGAFFADAGNIWNVYDNVTDEKSTFTGFTKRHCFGNWFRLRYDLTFLLYDLISDLKPIIRPTILEKNGLENTTLRTLF